MVYKKTEKEIEAEREKGKAGYSSGRMRPVYDGPICEYYVITKHGKKVDVWSLTPGQIADYIIETNDWTIVDHIKPSQHLTARDIVNLRKIKSLIGLDREDGGHIVDDIIGTLGQEVLAKAKAVVEYKREVEGIEIEEYEVLENMAEAERLAKVRAENAAKLG